MSEWIECGLVWDYIPVSYASPDLSSREKEVFGTTYLEECDKYNEIETHILSIYLVDSMNTYLKSLNDPKIDEYLEFDKWRDSYFEWYHQQPEIINFKRKMGEEVYKNSFIGKGLNEPGTLIETEDNYQYLIGDINIEGGVCDHCKAFENDTVVKRYKILDLK